MDLGTITQEVTICFLTHLYFGTFSQRLSREVAV